MKKRRVRLVITGVVQGVCFRYETRREARRRGLHGHVRNLSDGSVEVVAQGDDAAVGALIGWCRKGPPMARVDNVELAEQEADEAEPGFHVTW